MPPIQVSIKYAGKTYRNLDLDPDLPGSAFKQTVYEMTGIPPHRVKIMIKGFLLRDDTDWNKIGVKAGHTFTVVGAASDFPGPPSKAPVFLEDMLDADIADGFHVPVGLQNVGNTCYMNSTIQCLRAIPDLQIALKCFNPGRPDSNTRLTVALRDLYEDMNARTNHFPPLPFLQSLREVAPQFAEVVRGMHAQQDAEECWAQIMNSLGSTLPVTLLAEQSSKPQYFVEQFMMGEVTKELRCDEAPEEPTTVQKEKILKLECNISINTNYMHSGIKDALDGKVEKNSPVLGRTAVYTQKSRISRLPSNLTVHMVRFYWRRDINKKAKILRKVKFPFEFDALDLVTDDLKRRLTPLNIRLKEISRERQERQNLKRRLKTKPVGMDGPPVTSTSHLPTTIPGSVTSTPALGVESGTGLGGLDAESALQAAEAKELEDLIDPALKQDIGANLSGLYELCAIVTHKGASADSGHYIGFVKRDSYNLKDQSDGENEEWIRFDDHKVSCITREKIIPLEGGGEDSSAYILLYRRAIATTCPYYSNIHP